MAAISTAIAVGAVAHTAKGIHDSRKAEKDARKARRKQRSVADAQQELASLQLDLYKSQGLPSIQDYFAEAEGKVTPGSQREQLFAADQASADVSTAFAKIPGQYERGLRKFNVNPSDPKYQLSFQTEFNLAKAATEAGLRTKARRDSREIRFARLGGAANMARGIGQDARGGFSNAAGIHGDQYSQAMERKKAGDSAMLSGVRLMAGAASLGATAPQEGVRHRSDVPTPYPAPGVGRR